MQRPRPPIASDVFNRRLPLEPVSALHRGRPLRPAELGFPSPADEDLLSDSEDCLRRQLASASLCETPWESSLPGPLPQPPVASFFPVASPTPSLDSRYDLGMNAIVGGALPPTNVSLPTPPIAKAGRNLRLPSFDLLGIANPRPDRITSNPEQMFSLCGGGSLSQSGDPLHMHDTSLSNAHSGILPDRPGNFPAVSSSHFKPNHKPVHHFIHTFTPPDESGTLDWSSLARVTTQAVESPASGPDRPGPSRSVSASDTRHTGASARAPVTPATLAASPWLKDALRVLSKSDESSTWMLR